MKKKFEYKFSAAPALTILFSLCIAFLTYGLFTPGSGNTSQPFIPLQSFTVKTVGDPNKSEGLKPGEEKIPFWAVGDEPNVFYLGAPDPNKEDPNGFLFQLKFNSYGAAIEKLTICSGAIKISSDPNAKNTKPIDVLKPVKGTEDINVMTLANTFLLIMPQKTQLALDQLSWMQIGIDKSDAKKQSISFGSQIIYEGFPALRLVKTFSISAKSYLVDCRLTIENVSDNKQLFFFILNGPIGITRLGMIDERKVISAFIDSQKNIKPVVLDMNKLSQIKTFNDSLISSGSDTFLWSGIVNKSFASVIVPLPEGSDAFCRWIAYRLAGYYNPDNKNDSGDETIGVRLRTAPIVLNPNEKKTYGFELYAIPKDKQLFEKNKRFKELGFDKVLLSK